MIHILGGEFKGRRLLPPPPASGTRPITGLAKKSLFDTLAPVLADAEVVLDLYCGTGTMGLEALSRGAGRCWLAERDRAVLDRLRRNIASLGLQQRCTVWAGDVQATLPARLAGLPAPVDLAFIDPPYADARRWDWAAIERRTFTPLADALADEGLLVLRTPADAQPPPDIAGLQTWREKSYGQMRVTILQRPGRARAE